MRWETSGHPVPIIDDMSSPNCDLAAVNWAIPDALWSDHATEDNGSGPSYVANIVNALGTSTCTDNGVSYWDDTAIFVVWDDWGGWFDHINPNSQGGPQVNQTQGTWGAYYTYGFRVPLLVVSAYTGTCTNPPSCTTYTGYVSGACGQSPLPGCPNLTAPYVHDFGSMLAFIEWNFKIPIGTVGSIQYRFADYYAPEWNQGNGGAVPLLDFFPLASARPFQQIPIPSGYPLSYFQNYFNNNPNASPSGPDAEDTD
jgi:hypothetical protein